MNMEIAKIVEVVRAVEFYLSMFSETDFWKYDTHNPNSCDRCLYYEGTGTFRGDQLHTLFPDLTILDENTIRVNLHPNCDCLLTRVSS